MSIFDFHYDCAELERAGVDLASRAVLYELVGVPVFHGVFAPLSDNERVEKLVNYNPRFPQCGECPFGPLESKACLKNEACPTIMF